MKKFKDFYEVMGVKQRKQMARRMAKMGKSKIVQAKKLMHGKTSIIHNKNLGILKNIPKKFEATRYHSLIVDKKNFSSDLIITAETKDKVIMGIMHRKYNVHGVQFHPESIKTTMGIKILNNFIKLKH